ncbi:hypothetical protein ACFLZV_03940, partial [Candidatus Margulisiibacteriota bacterium]
TKLIMLFDDENIPFENWKSLSINEIGDLFAKSLQFGMNLSEQLNESKRDNKIINKENTSLSKKNINLDEKYQNLKKKFKTLKKKYKQQRTQIENLSSEHVNSSKKEKTSN